MEYEEIKAGLDKYMVGVEAKLNNTKNLSAKYIIKEHSRYINDGNDLFYVYAHYPTTEPDVMVMAFVSKANAELFCEALNAENERREADTVKHGKYYRDEFGVVRCTVCNQEAYFILGSYEYFDCCHHCGAKMNSKKGRK